MTDDAAAFGARLRAYRQSAGLSQEELAERSGLSVRAISNLERGRTRWPHPDSVRRLADALDLHGEARREFFATAGRRLAQEVIVSSSANPGGGPVQAGGGQVVPRQLPGPVRQFVGRKNELAALTRLLDEARTTRTAVVISAIGGTAGVGKTALAIRWAHQVAGEFPDGQLYVNLRGFVPGRQPAAPAEAVRWFLDALGVAPERIPRSDEAQAALYRSLVAGKRLLIVLDNARDVDQVRPLLPGAPGCLVLVTSRARLAGLAVSEGAHLMTLDVLTQREARQLLAGLLGPRRAAAEPGVVDELIGLCARLPLALAIAAARGVGRPGFQLATLATELRDAASPLDVLDAGDPASSVRAVLSWSYQSLDEPVARMFRLLGVHPGPDITVPAAASLAGIPPASARRMLAELTSANLLTEHAPGRFTFHDLLRTYAAELAQAGDDAERSAATGRLLDHYLHTAQAAALLLDPSRDPVIRASPAPGTTPENVTSHSQAMDWCRAECRVLIALIGFAAACGQHMHACHLPWTLEAYLDFEGHWHDLAATQRAALAAAKRLGDPAAQARAHITLGGCCIRLGHPEEARAHLELAARFYRHIDDPGSEAHCHYQLSRVFEAQRRFRDALGQARQTLELFRNAGHLSGQAKGLNGLGWLHTELGEFAQAVTCCQQALELFRELGDRYGQAAALDSLGYARHHLGQYAEAVDLYRSSLRLCRELGDRYGQADVLTHLGDTHHAAGDPASARDALQQALAILDDLRHPDASRVRAKLGPHPSR